MKAIVINSAKRTATEVNLDESKNILTQIREQIKCEWIELAPMSHDKFGIGKGQNIMYIDEEALLKESGTVLSSFRFKGTQDNGYVGNGIILGSDGQGNEASTTLKIEDIEGLEFGLLRIK